MTRVCLVGVSLAWLATTVIRAQAPAPAAAPSAPLGTAQSVGRIDYATQIQPILDEFCSDCHDGNTRKGGLSLATYADVLEGGRSGAIVRPGSSSTSLLIARIDGSTDPVMPKDEDPLTPDRQALLRAWIDEGARQTPTSPPAPQPWELPITLVAPSVPASPWPAWARPVDRLVADYLARVAHRTTPPEVVSDAVFARRAFLDAWGLLPDQAELHAFVADRRPDKRDRLVARLLADDERYAEHWMTFWNDLLRNEDGVTYFSEQNGRRSITPWLFDALRRNMPYDRFVSALLAPTGDEDPRGFLIGVNWRGETSAAVTPWMQASQNTAQVFLGVNMKCNACHDSFVNKWKLKDAYGLAAFFSPEPKLRLYRCDVARDEYTGPQFLFPGLQRAPRSDSLEDRREAAARIFTDPRNGRLPRTVVNRLWERLLGHGIVASSDEMDTRPWSPELLDWLASDFVAHGHDLRHLIATIMTSRAYQLPAVPRAAEPVAKGYVFEGPEVRRLTAEQFADAIGTLTGEWNTWPGPPAPGRPGPASVALRLDSDSPSSGVFGREWRAASNTLTRALGRPIRDQVISTRPDDATTPQALELVNGERLTAWLSRGARRLTGALDRPLYSRYNATIAGRAPKPRGFDLDVTGLSAVWLVVQDTGSNEPELVAPVWREVFLEQASGASTRLTELVTADGTRVQHRGDALLGVRAPSVVRLDLTGRGFVRMRGLVDIANARSEVGSTLNPSVRFFIFDSEPELGDLLPPSGTAPIPPPAPPTSARDLVDRVFWQALGRAPSDRERALAEQAVADPARPGRLSPTGVADFLWAVLMKPEFQLLF
ncbi:hypothetical protein TBR22_A12390 [Luteitalea sp. TBR-22]|uniref:DUF1549 domain-containing protein n=1 Tax=Luteitalea sp. TBR-22 TaxID=2802971 RepID=UPI001AFA2010|nr:DUF1549 domain-containing protein [Luteitalea sp. TBR-22]BCS32034.1 hypothetical protein TBR22_A12390 [Luteitalea sp. TBR-22]